MQLAAGELAQISKHLSRAEAILAALQVKPGKITVALGLGIIRNALLALDESDVSAARAARTLQTLRVAIANLNVPPIVHEHVSGAFAVLGSQQARALSDVEAACLADARYRQPLLRAELQGVRAELAGDEPAAALEPARRAQMIVEELGQQPAPVPQPGRDGSAMTLRKVDAVKSPQEAMAKLVQILGG